MYHINKSLLLNIQCELIALVTKSIKFDQLVAQIVLSIEIILGRVISDQEPAVAAAKRKDYFCEEN